MADLTSVADKATPLPSSDDIERAAKFTREPFLTDGEDAAVILAPGTPRRRALDCALAELAEGAKVPSVAWRREFSLLLGLERVLSDETPKLVDGTVLSAHQVDALSGTLTALLAEAQRGGNGNGKLADQELPEELLASSGVPGEEDIEEALEAALEEEDEVDEDDELDDEDEAEEEQAGEAQDWLDETEAAAEAEVEVEVSEQAEDPNAAKRFWFEHATGAGKTVAALGFVEASRTGGTLILTHRRNLVDQFNGELTDRGYKKRISPPLLVGDPDRADGLVTVETYQWFVRNAGKVSDAYTIVICDEAHTALGEKTSAAIRRWHGPVFVGMTATGALIARHVTDLFPTQTSRFDLAQAARRGVISPLRCVRIPPGPGVRTIAKVPLRRGEVDTEFDQEMLAELLDQQPFNLAIADLYKSRFASVPGVVYTAGVQHAYNVAKAFQAVGLKARAVSGETPKRQLAQILAAYERGTVDVLVNAQLLAEGWNSPRATVCMHLAPTASKRIYQQRVGRVTRRHPGKEAGIVIDFVHPATKHDDPVVTLHSLLDRDVYRGGAIVVGPVRRGRGRRLRVERRVVPVTSDENRRIEVFERELWRIAVEHLDYGEQVQWAALAGARVAPTGWRRARAMLHFDRGGELKRAFLLTAVQRNKNPQLRVRALQEIASSKDAEALDAAIEVVGQWPRDEKREGVKHVLQALSDKQIGRRDQANNWIWRCAEYTREVHEEYAVQRWPETKRLLGLLVNSSTSAHARNARRLVNAARQQDRRLAAALLAAAVPHTAEAGEVINGARTRMSRKPAALARDLLRNFPKPKGKRGGPRRRKRNADADGGAARQSGARQAGGRGRSRRRPAEKAGAGGDEQTKVEGTVGAAGVSGEKSESSTSAGTDAQFASGSTTTSSPDGTSGASSPEQATGEPARQLKSDSTNTGRRSRAATRGGRRATTAKGTEDASASTTASTPASSTAEPEPVAKKPSRRRVVRKSTSDTEPTTSTSTSTSASASAASVANAAEPAEKKPTRRRAPAKAKATTPTPATDTQKAPVKKRAPRKTKVSTDTEKD